MIKDLPKWASGALAVAGSVLVASMLLLWVDFDWASARGITLALTDDHWLLLVPIVGAALAAAASTRSPHTRLLAVAAGIVVAGDALFDVASSLVQSDLGTWLVLGGAGILVGSAAPSRAPWRAIGALAVLAGFFAPWASVSLFDVAWQVGFSSPSLLVLWLIPLAGAAGLLSAGAKTAGALGALAGGVVYATVAWVILTAAWQAFGLGAWLALGASTVALAIGVLARTTAPTVTPAPASVE